MNDKFMDAFRALDTELKTEGTTVLDYENSLEPLDQEKLKVCRIMRNYMSHNDTNFVTASNEQIKFLNTHVDNIRRKAHTVKDETKKLKPMKATEPIKNILAQIVKYPIVPLETATGGIYLVTQDIILKHLAAAKKKIDIPAKLPKYNTVASDTRIENVIDGQYIVLDSKTKKFIGIFIK